MIALQSVLAIADMKQFFQPGAWHQNTGHLADFPDIEDDNSTSSQSPEAPDIPIEQCELCHGHCHVLSMSYLPGTLSFLPGKSLTNYQANISSVAPSSPFRPPIV
ncbi:MAG: hypothetical protein ACJA05_000321 [Porticoccus sp.]|jgi:hypothetical protein